MSSEADTSVQALAMDWHIRLRDGDDATWDAFAEWLAEDERHALAYDAVERDDLALDELLPHVTFREAANDSADEPAMPPARRRWPLGLVGGGLAASAAAILAVVLLPLGGQDRYDVATRSGEVRVVRLDPATEVILNGATRMTFDRKDPRFASLEGGEAFFRVRHDADNPFRLTVGQHVVEDAGTQFNVVHEAGEVRVAVSEGKVVYNPSGAAIALAAGQALVDRAGTDVVRVSDVEIDSVGSWRNRSLVYAQAPLSQVAADIGRTLGARIEVSRDIAARPFSGTVVLQSTDIEHLDRLGRVLDVELERKADGWLMKPTGRADR
jgi:transmembrane sensor